jgi:hypothetical protein
VIPRVHKRGRDVRRLLAYLFGPGRHEEHRDPRLVAVWLSAGEMATLQPPRRGDGRHDVARLAELLRQPVQAADRPPKLWVWHCSVRNDPADPVLTDQRWAEIAAEVMDAVKLAPHADADAVRWVAVRHNDDHVHLVATLVRQDGRIAWGWNDYPNAVRRCAELEQRYGLRRAGPMDATSHRRPGAAELNKARRLGKSATARDELRRIVRAAAAASSGEEEFFARLADAGVRVERRASVRSPGEWTGYKVAHPDHTTARGEPLWFAGSSLANDLTLPKLRQRWADPTRPAGTTQTHDRVRVSVAARAKALADAAGAIRAAADAITHLAADDPRAAQAVAQAAADSLAAVAAAVEGRRGGPLTRAVDLFDKATREPGGRVAVATSRSANLRAMSRLVHLMGRVAGDSDTLAMLALLLDLARLADTLAMLREAQQRYHQAEAARVVAAILRGAATTGGRLGPSVPTLAGAEVTTPSRTATSSPSMPQPSRRDGQRFGAGR